MYITIPYTTYNIGGRKWQSQQFNLTTDDSATEVLAQGQNSKTDDFLLVFFLTLRNPLKIVPDNKQKPF